MCVCVCVCVCVRVRVRVRVCVRVIKLYIYTYKYANTYMCTYVWLAFWVLWHTNLGRLLKAKSIFIQMNRSISNDSV